MREDGLSECGVVRLRLHPMDAAVADTQWLCAQPSEQLSKLARVSDGL